MTVLKASIGAESVSLQVVAQQKSRVRRPAFYCAPLRESAAGFDWRGTGELAGRRASDARLRER